MPTIENPQLGLAYDYVRWTGKHVFLTGKAGTGKTTFLRSLQQRCTKRMIVVAPTGVAAINARGVTIHSFFQMPFGPIVSSANGIERMDSHGETLTRRFNRTKINIIRGLELLVIDEISMVRADLLDGIDAVLRRYRERERPFGGVQLLMIGDLQQRPVPPNNPVLAYGKGLTSLGRQPVVGVELLISTLLTRDRFHSSGVPGPRDRAQ